MFMDVRPTAAPSASGNNSSALIIGLVLLLAVAAAAIFLLNRKSESAATPNVVVEVKPAVPIIDTAKADEILRANRAFTEAQSLMEADDFMGAAKLWAETSTLSPSFARNYRDNIPTLSRYPHSLENCKLKIIAAHSQG
jgi:hypothetical protein